METTIKTIVHNINLETAQLQENLEKFEKGNKAAGQRARKNTLALAKLYKEFRAESVKI